MTLKSSDQQVLDAHDAQQARTQATPEGEVIARPWLLTLDTLVATISDLSPDTTLGDGTKACLVTLSIFSGLFSVIPADVNQVYLAGLPFGTSAQGVLRIELTQRPDLYISAADDVIFAVAFRNRGWEFEDAANLTVKLIWR